MKWKKIAVVGAGLLGGSILKAVKKKSLAEKTTAWCRSERAAGCVAAGGLAEVFMDTAESVAGADLVILCTPVDAMPGIAEQILPSLSPEALVTDVGSVKAWIEQEVGNKIKRKARWIGSHPMAGSEKTGVEIACENLFEGAVTIVTPGLLSDGKDFEEISSFWKSCGSGILSMTPEEHDKRTAEISHLPHLVSSLLVHTAEPASFPVASTGFRDTTRLAAGDPGLWQGIMIHNGKEMLAAIHKFKLQLEHAASLIRQENFEGLKSFLEEAQKVRNSLTLCDEK